MQPRSKSGKRTRRFAVLLAAATTIASMTGCAAKQQVAVREDAAITKDVQARLPAGSAIRVETREGVVSLIGAVGTEDERTAAETVARDTAGVRSVDNNVRFGAGR